MMQEEDLNTSKYPYRKKREKKIELRSCHSQTQLTYLNIFHSKIKMHSAIVCPQYTLVPSVGFLLHTSVLVVLLLMYGSRYSVLIYFIDV